MSNPDTAEADARDRWAIRLAQVSGIPIRVHFTFLLFLIWFAVSGFMHTGPLVIISTLALFFCIVLHELGHSLVAQRFGYVVRDITLYPIGGVAAIEGSPRPRHELYIALAGPAVNVVIALVLAAILAPLRQLPHWSWPPWSSAQNVVLLQNSPLAFLLIANISVVAFNMLPAFPMDGGRVLRAVLGLLIGKPRATLIAATIGQIMAVAMGLYGAGVIGGHANYGLCLIALFVYFGAGQERKIDITEELLDETPLAAAMTRDFHILAESDTLQHAANELLVTHQQDFPVRAASGAIVGVLSRRQLLRGLAAHGSAALVVGEMSLTPLFAQTEDSIEPYLDRANELALAHTPILLRDAAGTLVGIVTPEALLDYLTARRREE